MRWIERKALIAVIYVGGWTFGQSRAVVRWAHARLKKLEKESTS
jgi:hypothetical protein